MSYVSSEQKEEERLARILSGPIKPKTPVFPKSPSQPQVSPQTQKPNVTSPVSPRTTHNAPVESKLKAQQRAVKSAIDNAEREIAQGASKVEKHESTIIELRKKIEQEEDAIAALRETEANLQVVIMEKCVELETLNEQVEEEDNERERKAAQVAKDKEEFEAKVREEKRIAQESSVSANASSSYKTNFQAEPTVNVASFASRFEQEPVKDPVPFKKPVQPQEPKKNPADMTELEKEQERLNRTITKDPSKQPVKVNVAPVQKPVVVEKKVAEPVVKTPSLLEQLMEKEGSPTNFKYETWDANDTVFLTGTFTDWRLLEVPRIKGLFTVTLPIPPGEHLYRYKVNGKWELEKNKPKSMAPDGEYATKFQI